MATVAELRAQAADLMKQADEMAAADKKKLFESLIKKLEAEHLSIDDFMEWARPGKAKKTSFKDDANKVKKPPKFKGPAGEIWAGTGKMPTWAVALGDTEEARKKALEKYRIEAPAAA